MRNAAHIAVFLFSLSLASAELPGHRPRNVSPQITKPGVVEVFPPEPTYAVKYHDALIKRQAGCSSFSKGDATCGFMYDGEVIDCFSTDHCATSGSYLGCCSASGCDVTAANYWTACADYEVCASASVGFYTRCCSELIHPFCVTALVSGSTRGYNTLFICGNNVVQGIQTLSPTPSGWDATCPKSTSTPTTRPIPTTSASTTTTTTTTPTPPAPATSQTPVGAIAGGVVGGVAGLALIILAIFFAFRYGKNKGQPPQPEAPPLQPYVMPPPPGPSPHQEPVMAYAPAPGPQYVYHQPSSPVYHQSNSPVYQQQQQHSEPAAPYWAGSAGARKTSFEERVTSVTSSPGSEQVAQFPPQSRSPDPRISQFSASTAVASPRYPGPGVHELGVERGDGQLSEMRG